MSDSKNVIDIQGYEDKRVIFTYKKWKEKSIQHPELIKRVFLKNIEQTVIDPEEIWEDFSDKRCKRCYYKKYSISSYVKVVIWVCSDFYEVVTAFETNKIKEEKYSKIKKLK